MEVAFAFNTIVYLMIFIFPGFIFRKFYFRANLHNQNDTNSIEKILWMLVTSITCLCLSYGLLYLLRLVMDTSVLPTVSYEHCRQIFLALDKEVIPDVQKIGVHVSDYLWFFVGLYTISSALGHSSYSLIKVTGLDHKFPVLATNNYFHYLANTPKDHPLGNYQNVVTSIDLKLQYGDKEELICGDLHSYHLDGNKLHCVVLAKASRYLKFKIADTTEIQSEIESGSNEFQEYKSYGDTIIYKKRIPGDYFTVFAENIMNINFTFVNLSENQYKHLAVRLIHLIVNVLLYFGIIFADFIPWLNLSTYKIEGIADKGLIMTFGILMLNAVTGFINQKLGYRATNTRYFELALVLVLLAIPMLYAIDFLSGVQVAVCFPIFFIFLLIDSFLELQSQRKEQQRIENDQVNQQEAE